MPSKIYFYILLLLFASSCKQPCNEKKVKELMGKWYKQRIELPPNMQFLNAKTVKREYAIDINNLSKEDFYIIHYFQADCDKCVDELHKIQQFITKNDDFKNLKYLFIADGPTDLYAKESIGSLKFQFPVYYEKEFSEFKKINNFPIGDKLYNTLLVSKGELVLFGSPFDNEKAEALYLSLIYGCTQK